MKPNKYLDDVLNGELKSAEVLEREELLQKKIDLLSEYMKLDSNSSVISEEIKKLQKEMEGEEESVKYINKSTLRKKSYPSLSFGCISTVALLAALYFGGNYLVNKEINKEENPQSQDDFDYEKESERAKERANLEKKLSEQTRKEDSEIIRSGHDFVLEEIDDFFIFRNVLVDGVNHNISWTKNYLDNSQKKTQDDWLDYCKSQTEIPNLVIPSGLVYHTCLSSLFDNQKNKNVDSKLVKRAKEMFEKDFKDYWMATSTRIKYKVRPTLDEVVHDYKSLNPIVKQVALQGNDGDISRLNPNQELEAIFGSSDIAKIDEVYKWITGKNTYLWRLNNVTTEEERPLGVGVGDVDYFFVYAGYLFVGQRRARGVVVERAKSFIGNEGSK